jgi:hypothetical protein
LVTSKEDATLGEGASLPSFRQQSDAADAARSKEECDAKNFCYDTPQGGSQEFWYAHRETVETGNGRA